MPFSLMICHGFNDYWAKTFAGTFYAAYLCSERPCGGLFFPQTILTLNILCV